jgi:hypothetical protein
LIYRTPNQSNWGREKEMEEERRKKKKTMSEKKKGHFDLSHTTPKWKFKRKKTQILSLLLRFDEGTKGGRGGREKEIEKEQRKKKGHFDLSHTKPK